MASNQEMKEQVRKLQEQLKKQQELLKEAEKTNQELRSKYDRQAALIKESAPEKSARLTPIGFVSGISVASKNPSKREAYYKKVLGQEPVRGGFVAHSMFVRFVKNVHLELDEDLRDRKIAFEASAAGLVDALYTRANDSFLPYKKSDLEAPQSLVASLLLSMAVEQVLAGDTDLPKVHISHQGEFKLFNITTQSDLVTDNKAEYKVDIMGTVLSENMMKVIAAMEYKPDKRDEEARVAHRDMYATNTISEHQRSCIGIDIAGGNTVGDWAIDAKAYFGNPRKNSYSFEYSSLYSGKGLDGLFFVALGLCHAAQGWSDNIEKDEYRLGPVVAKHGERVLKGFEDCTYRQPNVEHLRTLLGDDTAEVWTSGDGKLCILDMVYRQCDWHEEVSTSVFCDIVSKLQTLHKKEKTHGDIRLANLLHSNGCGYIIDCDFVHRKFYPGGLKNLNVDGERHADVCTAIANDSIETLEKKSSHDFFSLGTVMGLFQCKNQEHNEFWQSAIDLLRDDKVDVLTLKNQPFTVQLSDQADELIFETGPTPKKCKKATKEPLTSLEE